MSAKNGSIWQILKNEWQIIFFGMLFVFLLFNIVVFNQLIPDLSNPLHYRNDANLTNSWIQRLIEGWIFNNDRMGFPFGSNSLDYPVPDLFPLFSLKFLSYFFKDNIIIFNVFFLMGFIFCFPTSYMVSRFLGLNIFLSFVLSILYAFVPFHFLRIHHLFYTWYFIIPIYIYIAYEINVLSENKRNIVPLNMFTYIFLGLFGVYYALFGMITVFVSGISHLIRTSQWNGFRKSIFINVFIILGFLISSAPFIIHKYTELKNPIAVNRSAIESELYGFKFAQLILPHDQHRIKKLRDFKNRYNHDFMLNNENTISALGGFSTIGLLIFLYVLLLKFSNKNVERNVNFLCLLTFTYFMFGNIGGFGTIFALFITPLVRGWNRISIFINYTCLLLFFLYIQKILDQAINRYRLASKNIYVITGVIILMFGIYDQTPYYSKAARIEVNKQFLIDKKFIQKIEKIMPAHSAIYQLPYMQYPEVPDLFKLQSYDLLSGFSYSKTLKWSYGGIKGRDGDKFFTDLSQKNIEMQIKKIKKLGFTGIYLDCRGYSDEGKAMILELNKLLGSPSSIREDRQVYFYKLNN